MKKVNKFYSLHIDKSLPKNEFELIELDKEQLSMITTAFIDGNEISGGEVIYRLTKETDYDKLFYKKILNTTPVYKVEELLDFHYQNYCKKYTNNKLFITHIEFVILPIVERKKCHKTYSKIILNWIKKEKMNLKQEKINKINYLKLAYKYARKKSPVAPTSVYFKLSKDKQYDLKAGKFVNNDEDRSGYIIGEELGISEAEVDNIVLYYSDKEIGFITTTLGLSIFFITMKAIRYLENIDDENKSQMAHNTINFNGNINSPMQLQQGSNNSKQIQNNNLSEKTLYDFFDLLKKDLKENKIEDKEDFETEIVYAEKQILKKRDISIQLKNIGNLMKTIGISTFANIVASPIYETIKPFLGLE